MQDVAYPNANGGPALFPVVAVRLRRTLPRGLAADPAAAAVRGPGLPARLRSSRPHRAAATTSPRCARSGSTWSAWCSTGASWSRTAGATRPTYLNRVAQVVGWARQQGIYVILDMHQDQYSRYILPAAKGTAPSGCSPSGGGDGAPGWAVQTDGKPGCALFGIDELNPAESAAFANFWQNSTVTAPAGPGARHRPAGPLHRRPGGAGPPLPEQPGRPWLRADERATARDAQLAAGRQRLPGQQPGPLPLLHPGHRSPDRRARRAAHLPDHRTRPRSPTPAPIRSWRRSAGSRSSSSRSPTGT